MEHGKLWGRVAAGARALGGFGGLGGSAVGAVGGGAGRPNGLGAGRARTDVMAGPRPLTRPELERVGWTGRPEGCAPSAQHVQVAQVVQRVLRGDGRSAEVFSQVPAGLPVVVADGRRLESAVAGLVDHAIRRSPAGARVLIRAHAAVGSGGPGEDRARVELRVVDRGRCELPEARQWLIAGMRSGGPTGPALNGLVRAAGGRLGVEATSGGGLTVVLTLAVARD
ncbi:hypothetical protein ACIGZJ_29855 [Kitasatospora sp. NPDC052868]|uniref:hypothetical protein n=1 Tax=Kitasatospora sp. NPDC052868 TaxID=3364060 RepID=UPI0037C69C84